jgi:hypothetical protein
MTTALLQGAVMETKAMEEAGAIKVTKWVDLETSAKEAVYRARHVVSLKTVDTAPETEITHHAALKALIHFTITTMKGVLAEAALQVSDHLAIAATTTAMAVDTDTIQTQKICMVQMFPEDFRVLTKTSIILTETVHKAEALA